MNEADEKTEENISTVTEFLPTLLLLKQYNR